MSKSEYDSCGRKAVKALCGDGESYRSRVAHHVSYVNGEFALSLLFRHLESGTRSLEQPNNTTYTDRCFPNPELFCLHHQNRAMRLVSEMLPALTS